MSELEQRLQALEERKNHLLRVLRDYSSQKDLSDHQRQAIYHFRSAHTYLEKIYGAGLRVSAHFLHNEEPPRKEDSVFCENYIWAYTCLSAHLFAMQNISRRVIRKKWERIAHDYAESADESQRLTAADYDTTVF